MADLGLPPRVPVCASASWCGCAGRTSISKNRRVRIVDFVSTLGYDMMPSVGKSHDAVRTIDLDDGLVEVLRHSRRHPGRATWRPTRVGARSDYVFTKPDGGQYHPMNLSRLLGDVHHGTRTSRG